MSAEEWKKVDEDIMHVCPKCGSVQLGPNCDREEVKKLCGMLAVAGLSVQPSYRRSEVCKLLGISRRHFFDLVAQYEIDSGTGRPARPDCLDSYKEGRELRVRFHELADYLTRNNLYQALSLHE